MKRFEPNIITEKTTHFLQKVTEILLNYVLENWTQIYKKIRTIQIKTHIQANMLND
jgi:hypothetical protein